MADKIFFKTGSASSLPTTKTAGQLLFAIDGTTGSIYLDKDSNTRIKFNADAVKLATPRSINGTTFDGSSDITTANWGTSRNISISDATGANTGTAVSVNGSQAVTLKLPATLVATLKGNADTATKATSADKATVSESCTGNAATASKLKTGVSINGSTFDGSAGITTTKWGTARIITVSDNTGDHTQANSGIDGSANFTIKLPATITATLVGNASSATYATSAGTADTAKACTGNAATASKLKAGVAINGTTFDGSAAITTTKWGTARNISIGNSDGTGAGTAVSVDGSGAVTLKLPTEIKANVTSAGKLSGDSSDVGDANTPVYFEDGIPKPITSIDVKSDRAGKLDPGATINGTLFTGESNITTSSWGTARTVTISDNDGTNTQANTGINGSANFTLKLPSTIKANLTGKATSAGTADTATTATTATTTTGNAGSATKLQTARSINGTSFDGSADITTANWGTARDITIGGTKKSVNGSQAYSWSLNEIGALPGKTTSATTAATAGWYRIATTTSSINNNLGQFTIQANPSGKHCLAIINAGVSYGYTDGINLQQMSYVKYATTPILTKARIVYHSTYSGNYAYLEVYVSSATATSISVQYSGFGWVLTAPSTAGSVPSGYSTKEITFVPNSIVSNLSGKATSAGSADSAAKLTTPRAINGTNFDGSSAITTANWGTPRTITIADNSSTYTQANANINGSADFTLKLPAVIKATLKGNADTATKATTADSATTATTCTGNAATATKLKTGVSINGTTFDGSGAITTGKWGTARTVTISDNTGANTQANSGIDGSNNFTLKLPATLAASITGNAATATKATSADSATTATTCTGNAATATKLKAGVAINGTSFDGSLAITTAKWGTSRTVTISDNDGTNTQANANIDGSANFTLKLPATIKANLSGKATSAGKADTATTATTATTCTGNAATASKLKTGVAINGTTFDGSTAITTDKWGTPRTLSISSTAGTTGTSIDGSKNESLIIPATLTGFTSITSTTFVGNLSGKATSAGKADSATTAASCTGNAATATKLATARSITLAGDVTGSTSFDGSGNVSITATVADDSHNHVISNIDNLQASLDSKADYLSAFAPASQSEVFYSKICTIKLPTGYTDMFLEFHLSGRTGKRWEIVRVGAYKSNSTAITEKYIRVSGHYGNVYSVTGYHYVDATNGDYLEIWCSVPSWDTVNVVRKTLTGNFATAKDCVTWNVAKSSAFPSTSTSTIKFDATLEEWSGAAVSLKNSRTINGTAFNGTSNITTSYWGTSRDFIIKDGSGNKGTAVPVNGNANVELILPTTIAATVSAADKLTVNAGDSSTPVYFEGGVPKPVTSIDVKSDKAAMLDPGAKINGTTFTGASDITTDKWGTERTISISSTAGTTGTKIDGSENKSLTIPSTMTGFASITSTTFVGNLSGKATSAGTADSATTASSCTGNAATADKLKTARNIALAGDVTGSTSFDGSGNVSITTAVGNDTHSHTYSTISLKGSYVSNTDYATLPNGITYVEMPATATVTGDPTYGAMLTVRESNGRAFQIVGNSSNKLYFRGMHSSLSSDAGTGYGPWKMVALSDGGTYAMHITGNASGTASKLATARNITISGTASSSVGTFDGGDNTTIYMPLTIQGFNEIKTKKLTITGTEQVSHIAFSRGAWNYFTAPTSGAFAFVPNGGTTTNGAGATFVITGTTVQPGEKNNTIDLGTSTYKWKNVYATTFTGALSGNATTATTLATPRNLTISDTASSSVASFNGGSNTTLYMPLTIKGFTSIESDKFVVNDKVTLQYNTTNECLEFVFA